MMSDAPLDVNVERPMLGTLFLVVGPSGVGKDTLLDGAREELEGELFQFPSRVITRPAASGGEDHEAATDAQFVEMETQGAFLHHWTAHGLRYGIPANIAKTLAAGVNAVVNTSRHEIDSIQKKIPNSLTIYISAPSNVIANRLWTRGRETKDEIARRLARSSEWAPEDRSFLEVHNDGTVKEGIKKLIDMIAGSSNLYATAREFRADFGSKKLCLLHRRNPIAIRLLAGVERINLSANGDTVTAVLGWTDDNSYLASESCAVSREVLTKLGIAEGQALCIERSPAPQSRTILQKKVRGGHLNPKEMHDVVRELVDGRFSSTEIAGFLVSAARNLTIDEVIEMTKARASYAHRQNWASDVVVDKHSMGGIPGNRISPIIIPIIAAFGLTIPKTSSRAITSAAGTADMMAVLAKIDLTPNQMQQVVNKTGACIAWNGRLTHSPVDDVMNSINQPLGLVSALLDVSSILSKKAAAGSTHVLIDLPIGPQAKTSTVEEGTKLKEIFETVGAGIGLDVRVNLADGTRPIGRGIGPILEAIDVLDVLSNKPGAPQDLSKKSIDYAANILEWTGCVHEGLGRSTAQNILYTGEAYDKLQEIIVWQGRQTGALNPGGFTGEIFAERSGRIQKIDIKFVSAIARSAGAPLDKSAGVRLYANVGSLVEKNQPLFRIYSSSQRGLDEALAKARTVLPIVSEWSDS